MALKSTTPPLVIFALDGADAGLIERWSEEGYLPTIAAIIKQGGRARIAGPELMSTVGGWLSLFSGIPPSEHGYYYNHQLVPGTYEVRRFAAGDAAATPFWSRLAGGDKRVAIIDALETQPVAGLSGVQLANWLVREQFEDPGNPPLVEPPGFLDEVHRVAGAPAPIDVFDPASTVRDDEAAYRGLLEHIEKKGVLCRHLPEQGRFDLTVVSFVEAHTAAHRFWDYRPEGERHDEAVGTADELSTAIRTVYRAIDREIGLLLDALPAESNVFVIALFGIRELYPTDTLTEAFCRQLGYQVSLPGAARSLSPLGILRRAIGADVRARMSRLLPLRVRRRLQIAALHDDTNWARTRAFYLPSLHTGFIRANCRGREPQGVIQPGTDYRNLLDELEADLGELVDMRSGEPAVINVIRTTDAFNCGIPRSLPDLVVEWRSGNYLMERVRHPRAELVQARQYYHRGTHHTMTGFMAAAGPSIVARTSISKVSPLEFAPVFLSLLGESAGRQNSEMRLMGLIDSGHLGPLEQDR